MSSKSTTIIETNSAHPKKQDKPNQEDIATCIISVSYTHLDVYKRQVTIVMYVLVAAILFLELMFQKSS